MTFEFATASRILFGPGVSKQAGAVAAEYGRRTLLVTGRSTERARGIVGCLAEQGTAASVLSVSGEPTLKVIEEGVGRFKDAKCDLVISIGGGSAIDSGKAIAAMAANPGELLDYLEVIGHGKPLPKDSAPFIAIPTTAGTGSEVTRNAVLGSPEHRVKVSLRSRSMLPRAAIVDPELTRDLPAAVTASTGLDALTQLIEAIVCSRANPFVSALCVEGIRRAGRSLRVAFRDPHNLAAREDMCLASLFGGLALANAGLGAVHGFAGPIGGMFPAPHGAICAILLPQVMAANIHALKTRQPASPVLARYDEIARLLTTNSQATAEDGVAWVRHLVSDLQIPRLGSYGIASTHVSELIPKARNASSMKANPIPLNDHELAEILERAI